ncbi:hypothetical protein [Campylobacter cuniculorum]|uniref:hypothetical protein n=1 Tax=Campylobacter cuniculorum TaxID=374106 RepID=UPI0023F1FCAB|nr:hypothetical protein [Campylobacter cuniculorum]
MKIYNLFLSLFLLSACSLKNEQIVATNLKTQTLMFSQKQKINIDGKNAVFTMSYLNPVLDLDSKDDVFALIVTPNTLDFKNLEVFVNNKLANIKFLDSNDELLKYLIDNQFSQYFKISLPSVKSEDRLKTIVCFEGVNCFELNFEKYSKSLYYRSKDVDTQYN